jgi:hypothetical protein
VKLTIEMIAPSLSWSDTRSPELKLFLHKVRKARTDLLRMTATLKEREAHPPSFPVTSPIKNVPVTNKVPLHRTSSLKLLAQPALVCAGRELDINIQILRITELPSVSTLEDSEVLRTAVEVHLPQVKCNIDKCKIFLARYNTHS